MNNKILVRCINSKQCVEYDRGITLADIAKEQKITLQSNILGALVNNRLERLDFELFHPKKVEFIDISHPDGMRMYIRSLSFLLYVALDKILPDTKLRVEHSISNGIYCELNNTDEPDDQKVKEIYEYMCELVTQDLPFQNKQEESDKVIDLFKREGLDDKVGLINTRGQSYTSYYKLKDKAASFYGYLVPSTSYLKVFSLHKYYKGILLLLPKALKPNEVENLVIQNKLFDIFKEYTDWTKILNITNVNDLNTLVHNGDPEILIKVSEALHEKKIAQIADKITERKDQIKIILISGPSSSGKTTFSKRLAVQLLVNGLKPRNLSFDDYFVDRDKTPLDENGEYDFEALEAVDIKQFNNDLHALLQGDEIKVPKFSFEEGKRYYDGTMKLNKDEILVLEGIHGLNPKLTHSIANESKYKIYVSALTSINIDNHNHIPTTDNRLIRRIVRDYRYRDYSAADTISRWQSVRRGEEKHIFPYQEEADVMFNSALLYELAILKHYIEPILLEVENNKPEYSEANRLLYFFKYFKRISDKNVPPTSIIREFLGGSSFNY